MGLQLKAHWWGAVEGSGLIVVIHGAQDAGPPELGGVVCTPAAVNHLGSALYPQNMLEQLLIHQPEDPIPFMIDHLQRDNDDGELLGGALPPPGNSWEPFCPPVSGGSQNRVGGVVTTWAGG